MAEYILQLKKREEVAENTMAFYFDISKTDFNFKPGQNATFTLINPPYTDDEGDTRTFSIASAPNKEEIMIASRVRNTAFKNSLKEIPMRAEIKVTGPAGTMAMPDGQNAILVLLAGGIGITPFRSMIEYATKNKLKNKIYLFYANKTPNSFAFLKDLENFAKENNNFKLMPFVTDYQGEEWGYEYGRYNIEIIKKIISDLSKPIFYIAGRPDSVASLKKMLIDAGVEENKVKAENFVGY